TRAIGDGGLDPDGGIELVIPGSPAHTVPPRWKDAKHVGWVSYTSFPASRTAWEIWSVEDVPSAVPQLVMRCDGALSSFDFLPDGKILASVRHEVTAADGGVATPMDLLVYEPDAATKACTLVRNLTGYDESAQFARDFALSPDKTTVAFYAG